MANDAVLLAERYECALTLEEVQKHRYRRVALQFPDELLKDAPRVCQALMAGARKRPRQVGAAQEGEEAQAQEEEEEEGPPLFFVIGDTSYGSCCVDEVAAQHLNADLVVHYGHACLSPTSRLPVLYVFGRRNLANAEAVATCIASTLRQRNRETRAFLFFDLAYGRAIPALADLVNTELEGSGIRFLAARLPLAATTPLLPSQLQDNDKPSLEKKNDDEEQRKVLFAGGLELEIEKEDDDQGEHEQQPVVVYLGRSEGNKQLANIMLRFNACACLSYDPNDSPCSSSSSSSSSCILREESLSTNQELKRRYYLVQRARDASVFGIVVGTLGVGRYMGVVAAVRQLIAKAGKKAYTLLVGKLNPAKLANFAEIEAFVLVACPEASLLEDGGRDFHAPVVTPLELEMALGGRAWDGFYTTDFRELGSLLDQKGGGGKKEEEEEEEEEGEDQPYFSLVSGGFKGGSGKATKAVDSSSALAHYQSPAGDFLQLREYRGLGHDTREGEEGEDGEEGEPRPPVGILEGRKGIASDYVGV